MALRIRCHSRVEVLYLQVRAAKLERLALKSLAVEPLWRPAGRLGDGRVRGALSELWELRANDRTSAQNWIKSKGKVCLSDNAYD